MVIDMLLQNMLC